jgi:hypothetical protein
LLSIRHRRFIHWLGVRASKFYAWRERYGRVNEHNGWIPRDFWLAPWEKQAIIHFHGEHPLEGYRRLTFVMLDADVRQLRRHCGGGTNTAHAELCYRAGIFMGFRQADTKIFPYGNILLNSPSKQVECSRTVT